LRDTSSFGFYIYDRELQAGFCFLYPQYQQTSGSTKSQAKKRHSGLRPELRLLTLREQRALSLVLCVQLCDHDRMIAVTAPE